MFRSVQWKLVLIYTLIILFAMQFFAVFLAQALENYYLEAFAGNMETQGLLLVNFLERYLDDTEETNDIDSLVVEYSRYAGINEIMVLDAFGRVISTSNPEKEFLGQRIIQEEITRALNGIRSEAVRLAPETQERTHYLALPVRSGEKNLGVVYLSGSLEPIYQTLREIQVILLTGALLVIGVTVVLGFFLAKTITVPIAEVTSKAALIAHGDLRQRVTVRSDDEIGRLGEMFNYLSRQLEATMQEISTEKSKVETILQHMTDGIVALDRDGQVLHVNPTARTLLGLPAGAAVTAEVLEPLFAGETITDITRSGKQKTRELTLPSQKIILAGYVPFHKEDEEAAQLLSGVLIVLHDVTKERELTRMQQEFVANVSHELRTPLTTLKSYTETLLNGALAEPKVSLAFLNTMEKEIERMVRLVKDLLVLSQIDHKQVRWQKAHFDLGAICREVVEEYRLKYKSEPRRVSLQLPARPVPVFVDRDRIKQVLINIIENAYKYTGENGRISVCVEQAAESAKITVTDDGIGIPPEEVERVFERFYRVDKARSREHGGTGLGLAIARDIVAAHHGTITLQSEPHKATTVTICLPLSAHKEEETVCVNG
ncbi:MAG TPA: cell wall metabolism sensor histidine kinase WalK [Firmicutes bacterium]|nr:cell wall metabolism sensor histidine kinase WalK [Bacillota bacterium]